MARRTKEEAQKTRERILDAATEVFYSRGVATPSLTDVAELAEVTRGAIYGHFKNKGDVFTALCDRIYLPLEAACQVSRPLNCSDALGALHRGWSDFFRRTATDEQQRKILTIIIHRCELLEENGLIFQRIEEGRKEGLADMAALLRLAVEQGQLPQDLHIEHALMFFHSTVTGLLSDWLLAPDTFDLIEVSSKALEGIVDTLRLSRAFRYP